MKKTMMLAIVALAGFSANAMADHRWDDDDCDHRHRHHHERHVMVQPVYMEPQVVYQAPPQVIYRDRVVYQERPVYYEAPPRYEAPPPRSYEQRQPAPAYYGNSGMGPVIGAVAGGVIGNRFGRGSGKVAATAAGAVIGSMVGSNVVTYGY